MDVEPKTNQCRNFGHEAQCGTNTRNEGGKPADPGSGGVASAPETGSKMLDAFIRQAIRDEAIVNKLKAAVILGDKDEVFALAKELTK